MTDTLALMAAGFMHAISPINLLAMLASTIVGITIGCLPGLSAAMGVALLLPVTFGMDPATGLIVLGGIYCGAIFGGSISAILIHTPGTPASAATAIEGYQLTLRGKAAKALFTACFASFCGGLLSCISLYFFSPLLAQLAMKFKSPEYFWLSIFGLTIIAGVSSRSILKGLMSGILGLLISTIGMDPMEGVERYMFGVSTLYNGVGAPDGLWLPGHNSHNQVKAIRTRNGHTVEIHDEGENGYIRIYDNGKENYILTFSTDQKLIKLESTGNIELYAANDIIMHAGHDINASADNDIFIAARRDMQRTADNDIRERAGNDRTTNIDRNDSLTVSQNQLIRIDDNKDEQVAHKLQLTAENIREEAKDKFLQYSTTHHQKASDQVAVNAGNRIDIKGGIVKVN